MATVFEPIRPVPPITTIFMLTPPLSLDALGFGVERRCAFYARRTTGSFPNRPRFARSCCKQARFHKTHDGTRRSGERWTGSCNHPGPAALPVAQFAIDWPLADSTNAKQSVPPSEGQS